MGVSNFKELREHIGHKIVCVKYQRHRDEPIYNVAIECETCNEVLLDFDNPEVNLKSG